jgi:DNA-binding response OmpR family regulator
MCEQPQAIPELKHKVLIADDTPVNRFVLQHAAQNQGLEVVTVTNGEEAIAALEEHPDITLALLDWMMPKVSGVDVARWIRDREAAQKQLPYTYVIMVTAKDQREDLHKGLIAGADDYLVKPVDPTELRLRIETGKRMVDIQARLQRKIEELKESMAEVQTLQGMLPMCMYCNKVRDDSGYWERVEKYIQRQSGADISHGICPTCYETQLATLDDL